MGWKQRIELVDFDGGQTGENIREVILRIDAAAAATDENGINYGATPTGIRVSDEEPALAADGSGTNGVFDEVVIDFESAVAEISRQGIIIVEEVAHRLTQRAFRQKTGVKRFRLRLEAAPDFRCLLTASEALVERKSADFILDSIEQADLRNKPCRIGEVLLECLVRVTTRVSQTADALDARLAAAERLVNFVSVGLDSAGKPANRFCTGASPRLESKSSKTSPPGTA